MDWPARKFFEELTEDILRFSRNEFVLADSVEGGGTNLEHFRQLEKSGYTVPELHEPPPNPIVRHLWWYFRELSSMRGTNGYGPNPIGFNSLIDWQKLRGINLLPFEIDLLLKIEYEFLSHQSKRLRKK